MHRQPYACVMCAVSITSNTWPPCPCGVFNAKVHHADGRTSAECLPSALLECDYHYACQVSLPAVQHSEHSPRIPRHHFMVTVHDCKFACQVDHNSHECTCTMHLPALIYLRRTCSVLTTKPAMSAPLLCSIPGTTSVSPDASSTSKCRIANSSFKWTTVPVIALPR